MRKNTTDDIDKAMMEYTCGRCGAGPDEWCKTRKGGDADELHQSRRTQYQEAKKS